ncbi:MAG: PEGA domain-containing protein [Bacteroidota bacterium]
MPRRITFFVFFILCLPLGLLAQEFDVREFSADPTDLAAIRYPRRSVNDDPCALVKVITNISDMKFDSNQGIVDIVHQDEGYWLYLAPRERRITLMAEGYLPLDVNVPEPAVANRVYRLVVTSKGTAGNLNIIPVNIIIEEHPDAKLFINGEAYDFDQTLGLPRGTNQIRIEKPGYQVIEQEIEVSETSTLFRFYLDGINEEVLTLRTDPPGAAVYINNVRQRNVTPFQEFFLPGEYSLRLTLSEYKDIQTNVQVRANQNNEFSFTMEKFVGTLALTVQPASARVLINQRDYTGEKEIQFAPGTYRMVVEKEGYYSYDERFVIEEGTRSSIEVSLDPMLGNVRFISANPDARYKLFSANGQQIESWTGTTQLRDIPVGNYRYEGDLEGYATLSGQVVVEENRETRVEAVFTEQQRLEYIREQERQQQMIAEKQKQEMLSEKLEQDEQQKKRQQTMQNIFGQRVYNAMFLSYSQLNLNTVNFRENIQSSQGFGVGFQFFYKYWSVSYGLGYNMMKLSNTAQSRFNAEELGVLEGYITTGPKVRLAGFELFLNAGLEGSFLYFDGLDDDFSVGDVVLEYGVALMPWSWGVGVRYAQSIPLGILDSYPPFSRRELGLIIRL